MKKSKVYALCEGAIMVALATALSYVKLMELPQGGSVCIGMLPLFIYFYRWDWKHSFLAAFAYGLLQLIFDGAYAWGPTSMLLDYVLAFGVLGVACLFRKQKGGVFVGTVVGCAALSSTSSAASRSTASMSRPRSLIRPSPTPTSIPPSTTAAMCSSTWCSASSSPRCSTARYPAISRRRRQSRQ